METDNPIPPETSDRLNETTEKISDAATQAWDTTREKAGEALDTGEKYVRENPGTSVLSIFGLGVLVGVLIGWSVAHEDRDDYSATARKYAKRWGKKLNLD